MQPSAPVREALAHHWQVLASVTDEQRAAQSMERVVEAIAQRTGRPKDEIRNEELERRCATP
jgi:hypothetical protein